MSEQRVPGRPPRGANQVGRMRIIESVRTMLRNGNYDDLSRKSVARYLNITPALITYYFPHRSSLIQEATQPIIQQYLMKLREIIYGDDFNDEKIYKIIQMFVSCYVDDGDILNAYQLYVRTEAGDGQQNLIKTMSDELSHFFTGVPYLDEEFPFWADLLRSAVWGMCEFVGKTSRETHRRPAGACEDPMLSAVIARQLFALIKGGLPRSDVLLQPGLTTFDREMCEQPM